MPPPQQQQQGNVDNSMAPVWIMVLCFLIVVIAWYAAHDAIVRFILKVDEFQVRFLLLFIDPPALKNLLFLTQTLPASQMQWQDLVSLTEAVGNYMRYPVIGFCLLLAIWLYTSDVTLRFRKTYTMKTLREQEQANWPEIMPIIKEDLVKVDIDNGPWAMALLPMEFARKYDLLKKNDVVMDKAMPGMEMTAGIRKGDAKRIFTLQLGSYWEGFDNCPPYMWALAAVFMARINRDRDGASHILKTLDKSFEKGKLNYSVARPILKKHISTQIVQDILNSHGYVLTVMASLLAEARLDGVLASAEFLWLKVVDRRLWYMLNCVGRQTPYVEVAGPFSHWLAEKAMKRRSRVPMIDEATKALEGAIKEVKLTPRQMQELKP